MTSTAAHSVHFFLGCTFSVEGISIDSFFFSQQSSSSGSECEAVKQKLYANTLCRTPSATNLDLRGQ